MPVLGAGEVAPGRWGVRCRHSERLGVAVAGDIVALRRTLRHGQGGRHDLERHLPGGVQGQRPAPGDGAERVGLGRAAQDGARRPLPGGPCRRAGGTVVRLGGVGEQRHLSPGREGCSPLATPTGRRAHPPLVPGADGGAAPPAHRRRVQPVGQRKPERPHPVPSRRVVRPAPGPQGRGQPLGDQPLGQRPQPPTGGEDLLGGALPGLPRLVLRQRRVGPDHRPGEVALAHDYDRGVADHDASAVVGGRRYLHLMPEQLARAGGVVERWRTSEAAVTSAQLAPKLRGRGRSDRSDIERLDP